MTTAITIGMIIIYVAIMMGIGVYTARQTRSVSDFVLGGHSVGSWLTAFAYGTSYFSAVVFIGYGRTVRLDIRRFCRMGRHRQRPAGQSAGMDRPGTAHPHHDAVAGRKKPCRNTSKSAGTPKD